jgi:hypothetical protein
MTRILLSSSIVSFARGVLKPAPTYAGCRIVRHLQGWIVQSRSHSASARAAFGIAPEAIAPAAQSVHHHAPFTLFTLTKCRMLGARNQVGLTNDQIQRCLQTWEFLCGKVQRPLDLSEAARHGSRTRYDERRRVVILGADAYPGTGKSANSRLSMLACLAHELAHMLRALRGFKRPLTLPDLCLDEAETSIYAAFLKNVWPRDREDLVEDARDRLIEWLAFPKE